MPAALEPAAGEPDAIATDSSAPRPAASEATINRRGSIKSGAVKSAAFVAGAMKLGGTKFRSAKSAASTAASVTPERAAATVAPESGAIASVAPEAVATRPSATRSSATKPSATKPTATSSSVTKPTATRTSATKPGAAKPTADVPKAVAAETSAANSSEPDSSTPDKVGAAATDSAATAPNAAATALSTTATVPSAAATDTSTATTDTSTAEADQAAPLDEQPPRASGTPASNPATEPDDPATPGPAGTTENATPKKPGKPKKTKLPGKDPLWAKATVAFGIVLVLAAGTALGAMQFLTNRFNHSVTQQTLLAPQARVTQPAQEAHNALTGPLNFLLLGSDLRADDPEDGQRSDTIIIVHIPATLDRAYMISIPRDLRVAIPPFGATGFGGGHEKINGAFQYGGGGAGGVQLLSQTLTNLTGVQFDGAAIINFDGFEAAVKLLGGIDLCVDVATESHFIGYDKDGNFLAPYYGPDLANRNRESTPLVYEPGCRHFPAYQALDYVRQRKSLPNGDYDRQRHQQQFVKAIFDEAQAQNLTSNPLKLDKFIRAVGSSLTVDTNGVSMDDLLFGLREVRPAGMRGVQVPSAPQMIGGISYVIADPAAEGLYKALKNDTLEDWASQNPTWLNQL